MKPNIIVICGPTASGKTALSVALAKELGGEVVSADSMQIYRRMDIGTAKPTKEEMDGVPHHMIDVADPEENYSVARYVEEAGKCCDEIISRGKLPILVGGTGLYIDSLVSGRDFADNQEDMALRHELEAEYERLGGDAMLEKLAAFDPIRAAKLSHGDRRRIIRAIEIYMTTGRTKTEIDREQVAGEPRYDDTPIILDYADRAILYDRIERRVDIMIEDGLIPEIERIFMSGRAISRTASQAIGYKELIPYLRGECALEAAVAELKLATRHYAKRQIMWFRRYDKVIRFAPDRDGRVMSACEIANEILTSENKI